MEEKSGAIHIIMLHLSLMVTLKIPVGQILIACPHYTGHTNGQGRRGKNLDSTEMGVSV